MTTKPRPERRGFVIHRCQTVDRVLDYYKIGTTGSQQSQAKGSTINGKTGEEPVDIASIPADATYRDIVSILIPGTKPVNGPDGVYYTAKLTDGGRVTVDRGRVKFYNADMQLHRENGPAHLWDETVFITLFDEYALWGWPVSESQHAAIMALDDQARALVRTLFQDAYKAGDVLNPTDVDRFIEVAKVICEVPPA